MSETPPQPEPKHRADRAEVQARVKLILDARLAGADFSDLLQIASVNQWGIGERQLWNYVRSADQMLAQTTEADRGKHLRLQLGQRRLLYAKAVESGDWRAALAVKKDEAELLGLYDPPPPDAPTGTPPAGAKELAALLAELIAEARVGKVDGGLASTITGLVSAQLKALEAGSIEERLEALEQQLAQRETGR